MRGANGPKTHNIKKRAKIKTNRPFRNTQRAKKTNNKNASAFFPYDKL